MKQSMRDIIKAFGGWRPIPLLAAFHMYLYFGFYQKYNNCLWVLWKWTLRVLQPLERLRIKWPTRFMRWVWCAGINTYHGKVMSKDDVTKILTLDKDVMIGEDSTRQIIPFKWATDIIFEEPKYIAVMDCCCRQNCSNPPTERKDMNCCLAVGKNLTAFWMEHAQNNNVRMISQQEALDIIEYQHSLGSITTMWGKVGTGSKTGVICSCRPDVCASLYIQLEASKLKYGGRKIVDSAPSGYLVLRDAEACINCGECVSICNFDARTMDDGSPAYEKELCMGCGLCVEHCPQSALSLYSAYEETGLYPLDIDLSEGFVAAARNSGSIRPRTLYPTLREPDKDEPIKGKFTQKLYGHHS